MGARSQRLGVAFIFLATAIGLFAGAGAARGQAWISGATIGPPRPSFPYEVPAPAPTATPPSPDLERRVRELEQTIRQLKGDAQEPSFRPAALTQRTPEEGVQSPRGFEPVPLETGATPGSGTSGGDKAGKLAGWDNGFFMRSSDGAYQLRITGQIQADVRDFLRHEDLTDTSTFLVRRARLGIEATVFQYYEFRLLPDFGQGRSIVQDAYLNIHYLDAFQVTAGKFKEPVSYEELIQDRFVPTMERSIIDQLVPGRDVGVMVHGENLLGNRLDYALGVFNGGINGDQDTNGRKDFAWRLAVRPFNSESFTPALHLLQFGISGTTGVEEEPINPATLRTPATVPFFQFNSSVRANGLRNRWTPEISYFYHGLGFAAQYFRQDQRIEASFASDPVNVPFNGFYLMGTYLLTGEDRKTYSEAIVPLRSFDPLHPLASPGAWELVARVSHLEVGSVVFAPGAAQLADPTKYSRIASELTLGFNWYLNPWVRTQFNWEHAWFASPVQLGPGPSGFLRLQDTVYARLQVIF
jgi:phosphate-selective porin OprO/OprP